MVNMKYENPWVNFDDPPVTEVVVAVAFAPIPSLTMAHMGVFWSKYLAHHFPTVQEQAPYDPPIERFDESEPTGLSLKLENRPPLPRLWFKSHDEQELIQLQRDWFACNWRKVDPDAEYGRWSHRRDSFHTWFSSFVRFISELNLGAVRPTQCEVTYLNHIHPDSVWSSHSELAKITTLAGKPRDFLPPAEEVRLHYKYVIGSDGVRVGRLHVQCDPVIDRKDGTPAFAFNLTARGAPFDESVEGVLKFLEVGREWVTRSFKAITTTEMHHVWGIRDD